MNSIRVSIIAGLALATAACNGNPSAGSPAYKEGELGNGDFLFACDDGAACLPYSGDAKKFPEAIATGANFGLRFVANGEQGSSITINEKRYDGVTLRAIAPYVGEGPEGFAALQPGYGTVIVKDSTGAVIDFVTLKIVKPSGLIVYDADAATSARRDPPQIQAMNFKVGDRTHYRVVAEHDERSVAGSINVAWASDNDTIVEVESYTGGVVNLIAKGAGTANLTATAGGLDKIVKVTVAQ